MPPGRGNPLRNVPLSYAELPPTTPRYAPTTAGTHQSARSIGRLGRPTQPVGSNVRNAVSRSVSHSESFHSLALQLTMIE